ncbi:hypothetical protein HHK36_012365 [Tetracentron sinense]|uniref:Exopolygalacturonase-like n=1 Tax=Tetracentron sinense TaxID=13715 RepID=A0A834Z947_TETSI|nr:hypothetical protein HHK36_012365 [Tetracentron sinense]
MAPPTDLAKVGKEGFALLDECLGRKVSKPTQQPHAYQLQKMGTQYLPRKEDIDCYQAFQMYGGTLIVEYRTIREYSTNKPPRLRVGMAMTKSDVKAILLLCLALLAFGPKCTFGGRPGADSAPAGSGTVFNVLTYGAQAGGKKDNTQAFMKAWLAACHSKGDAKLLIPTGTFLVGQVAFQGPCSTSSPIVVELQGTVIAPTDVSEFPSPEWFSFEKLDGLIVTGGGTFDGQGAAVWKYNNCKKSSNCQLLPTSIKFSYVTNGEVRTIHSINSKAFHFHINNCDNIKVHDISITAPGDSPNTDGIHVSSSNLVNISKVAIGTGDDCVSIGQGSTDISITGVTCGPGHGISVGSLGKYPNEKDVKGVTVKNCTLKNSDNGVRIKTWPGSNPSLASSFIFEDIIVDNVKNPIIIDQQYCAGSSCKKNPSRVQISDVHYKNIRGTSTSEVAVDIICSPQFPCEDVELDDIDIKYSGVKAKSLGASSACSNAKVVYGGVQNPPPCP